MSGAVLVADQRRFDPGRVPDEEARLAEVRGHVEDEGRRRLLARPEGPFEGRREAVRRLPGPRRGERRGEPPARGVDEVDRCAGWASAARSRETRPSSRDRTMPGRSRRAATATGPRRPRSSRRGGSRSRRRSFGLRRAGSGRARPPRPRRGEGRRRTRRRAPPPRAGAPAAGAAPRPRRRRASARPKSRKPAPRNASRTSGASGGTKTAAPSRQRALHHKVSLQKKSASAGVGDEGFEVPEVALEGAASGRRQPVGRPRDPALEPLRAVDVTGLLQAPGVHRQVAVRRVEEGLELVEGQGRGWRRARSRSPGACARGSPGRARAAASARPGAPGPRARERGPGP